MDILVNGERHRVEEGRTVEDLLQALSVRRAGTAVERNEEVVPRSEYATTVLREGDRLEIVNMLGGG